MAARQRRVRPDFILVQLSPAGLRHAGNDATVRVASAHLHYIFTGGEPTEVLRAGEWPSLRRHRDAQGEPLFQEFQQPAPAAAEAVEIAKDEVS